MKFKIPLGVIIAFNLLIIATIVLVSIFPIAKGIFLNEEEYIRIWGSSFVINLIYSEYNYNDNYNFGPGYYGAIKPLFKIGMILVFVFSFFLLAPPDKIPKLNKDNFLFWRIGRGLLIVGGVCGFAAFMVFAKFFSRLNFFSGFAYKPTFFFYLGVATFGLAIVLGLLSVISVIEAVPYKKKDDFEELIEKNQIKEKPTVEITREEEIELIISFLKEKRKTSLDYLEDTTMISRETIIDIVTNDLYMTIEEDNILPV